MRKFRKYDGTEVTSKHLEQILPSVLSDLQKAYVCSFHTIQAAWPQMVGPQISAQAYPYSLLEGKLTVIVRNSTLYSLLSRYEKGRILRQLQQQFPKSNIDDIVFRMG